jgi:dTDP-glucose 4,6-dehydratase
MRALITGGSGFVGSNLIRSLSQRHPSWILINYSRGDSELALNERQLMNYKFVRGNLSNEDLLIKNLEGVDCVFHIAAESHARKAEEKPLQTLESNVLGTQTLLNAIKKNQVRKLVFLSSTEVYGINTNGPLQGFSETNSLSPQGNYAATKAASEMLVLAHHNAIGTPTVIARSCNIFGPWQAPNKIIPKFTTNIMNGNRVTLYGKGDDLRTYVYVDDLCNALDLLALKGRPGETYNIATDDIISNLGLAKTLIEKLGMDEKYIGFIPNTTSNGTRFRIDSRKIRSIGWTSKTDLSEGLDKTIQWYKDNQDWWKQKLKNLA